MRCAAGLRSRSRRLDRACAIDGRTRPAAASARLQVLAAGAAYSTLLADLAEQLDQRHSLKEEVMLGDASLDIAVPDRQTRGQVWCIEYDGP